MNEPTTSAGPQLNIARLTWQSNMIKVDKIGDKIALHITMRYRLVECILRLICHCCTCRTVITQNESHRPAAACKLPESLAISGTYILEVVCKKKMRHLRSVSAVRGRTGGMSRTGRVCVGFGCAVPVGRCHLSCRRGAICRCVPGSGTCLCRKVGAKLTN